ncbi:MAG: SAM-dependent methyltransferase [Desulfobacteraceae bacterium]|nr:MAG: SAM-dependent methyltransferase [Desulfobacteraceae bacterium]
MKKAALGQFFTPGKIARFMASLFTQTDNTSCRLLDAGAGIGSLSAAFLERWISGGFNFKHVSVDAFEIDETLLPDLTRSIEGYKTYTDITFNIRNNDFIEAAVDSLCGNLFVKALPKYSHTILNPPYKKIRNNSLHRAMLRQAGIETVNLYSAFVALSLALLNDNGQLVAIIPRSFCNGPYYHPFRKFILERAALQHIHLFTSRNNAFKDDDVLQENVIIMMKRGGQQGDVAITTSNDANFTNMKSFVHPFHAIVSPDDSQIFIHVPTSLEKNAIELSESIRYSLDEIGIMVSTGPVVDFRLKEHLDEMPGATSVPLLYPGHFNGRTIHWPKLKFNKPNAINRNEKTEKWLYPNGFYCIVRRFSSKEEKRRIVAGVVDPDCFSDTEMLGFENHLNVFHEGKKGLPKSLAYGLATFLNTTAVDENFRCFNGHTQVNATDLRRIKYPSRQALMNMGEWSIHCKNPTQVLIDEQLKNLDI